MLPYSLLFIVVGLKHTGSPIEYDTTTNCNDREVILSIGDDHVLPLGYCICMTNTVDRRSSA